MIRGNISALIVAVRLNLLKMSTMVKKDELALDAIRYLMIVHTKELIFVYSYQQDGWLVPIIRQVNRLVLVLRRPETSATDK